MISISRRFIRSIALVSMLAVVLSFTTHGVAEEPQNSPATCIIYVNVSVSGGNGSGSSWANATPDLQNAITNAAAGCEIWVAKGTYGPKGTSRLGGISLKQGVAVYGGFNGNETNRLDRNWQTNVTTISGEKGDPANDADNYYNVVWAFNVDSTTILDGFTITAGYADDTTYGYNYGGGLEIFHSSPTLSNLIITENLADYGGGIGFSYYSSPVLTNVVITNNFTLSAGGLGAGVYVRNSSHPVLNEVKFYNNVANTDGGGLYNDQTSSGLTLTDVVFDGNTAYHGGGGMYNYKIHADLTRVKFLYNHAAFGGGLCIDSDNTNTALINVEFGGNEATNTGGKGGGLYNYASNPTLTNVFFTQNSAYYFGGGIGNYASSPTLTNVSFSLNTAPNGAGIYNSEYSHPLIRNSILWGDSIGEIYHDPAFNPSTITISNSLVQGCNPGGTWNNTVCGASGGNNLVDADPKFTSPVGYDFHLKIGSPAINRGNNTFVSGITQDMDGKPRIQNGVVDLGPYELLFYPIYLPLTIKQ